MRKLCKCGCGQKVSKSINNYILGHYFRGKKRGPHSQEHNKKIRENTIKAYNKKEVREKQKVNTPKGKDHYCYGTKGNWKGRSHTEETKIKMSLSQLGDKHHFRGKKHKEETKKKTSESCKQWWDSFSGIKQRKKQSKKMKRGQAAYCNQFIKDPSKPQVELFNKVKTLFNTAVLNYPFFNYSLDIVIFEKRLVIEYDGSYWHQDHEYDKRRQKYLEKHKWKYMKYVDNVPTIEKLEEDIKDLI